MFGLFKRREKQVTEPVTEIKPSEGINYDSGLIDQFHAEHQALLNLFTAIKASAEKQDFKSVRKNLKKFTSILRGHLLTENVKLYVYLSKELAHDPENKDIIMTFRREMMGIGKAVNQFVTRYGKETWTAEMERTFLPELVSIGEVLVHRIEQEESTLYPLYMPEAHYHSVSAL